MARKSKPAPRTSTLNRTTMDFLGLSQQPFIHSILANDAIFTHAALTKLKDIIKHQLQSGDRILVIEGDYGSGKTTIFRQLMQEDVSNVFLIPLQAEATDTLLQLQHKMAIHLKEQGEANQLEDNLKSLQMFDQAPVLMIDDAHVVSDTTLQELVRYRQQLFAEHQLQLKVLLFANQGMAKTIAQVSDIQHNQILIQKMPRLDTRQIPAFISHRLAAAGASQPPSLDDRTVATIFKKTAGNPLRVMAQAAFAYEKLSKTAGRAFPLTLPRNAVSLMLLLVVAAVAGAYFYLSAPEPMPVTSQDPALTAPASAMSEPATPSPKFARNPDPGPVDEAPEPVIEPAETIEPPQAMAVQPMVAGETSTPAPVNHAPPIPASRHTGAAATAVPERKAPVGVTTDTKPDSSETGVDMNSTAPPAPAPAIAPQKYRNPALHALAELGLKDFRWLQQQNPQHWTLQILGTRDPASLVVFVKQHSLGDDTAWYLTDLKGQPWYVLVHRLYASREAANESIQHLPAELRKNRPWVKSMAAVQKSIKTP